MKVIVIGSGIVGASAAYHLAKRNIDVIVIDKEHQGNATAAGAGIVCPWASSKAEDEKWYEMAKRGAAFYPELISQLQEDGEQNVGYKKVGALCVRSNPEELDQIEHKIRDKKKKAPEIGDITRLDSTQSRERFPLLNERLESIFISGGARVDGKQLRDAINRAAQKHGAVFVQGEAELLVKKEQLTGASVNGQEFSADSVLIAAGAWAPSLLKPLGLECKLEPQRGQIAHIKLQDEDTSNWPIILPPTSHYMLAFDDSRVVAGATRETGSGFDYRLTAGGVSEVVNEALEVAPGLGEGTLQEVRIGFRPMGVDQSPLLGTVQPFRNMVMANGLGASGLTMGPYVGCLAASLITGENMEIDISPYEPMRAVKIK
ncbi:D-amino-acid dehydrogenase [Alteribacillus persepolensis]|uniref:D-amino-acid dehydrogenase n=1 Tax=Alteribacillus persepolensis TaxID=568899 RepID=A0A1G8F843_9BACI|nr:FAD-binding oxidoreductase [Alteribacillus persepolensis]SDH78235.1 D-amino-acid dehydrogenase [Alteribacillus persepolensis]